MDSIFATPISEKTDRELLLEMHEKLDQIEKRQKRRAVFTTVAVSVLIIALAICVILMLPGYQAFKAQYDAVAQTVQQINETIKGIDLAGLTSAADFLAGIDYNKLAELSALLDEMDAETLSQQLNEVTNLIDQLGKLNTEALVENINLIIEKLQPVMNWFR